jgi:hypothetical protein
MNTENCGVTEIFAILNEIREKYPIADPPTKIADQTINQCHNTIVLCLGKVHSNREKKGKIVLLQIL